MLIQRWSEVKKFPPQKKKSTFRWKLRRWDRRELNQYVFLYGCLSTSCHSFPAPKRLCILIRQYQKPPDLKSCGDRNISAEFFKNNGANCTLSLNRFSRFSPANQAAMAPSRSPLFPGNGLTSAGHKARMRFAKARRCFRTKGGSYRDAKYLEGTGGCQMTKLN